MEEESQQSPTDDTECEGKKDHNPSNCVVIQPKANGTLRLHNTDEAAIALPDRSEGSESSDDSLIDSSSTTDVSRLLPTQPASGLRKHKDVDASSVSPPICVPPSKSFPTPPPPSPSPREPRTCNRHHHHPHPHHNRRGANQKQLPPPRHSTSLRTDAAHIKEVAGDDCCVHCLLACLYCELLSVCSALAQCVTCCEGAEAGCCQAACIEGACTEAACTEEACQAVLDCGILEDCCGSSDCLEICLECCSICFPS